MGSILGNCQPFTFCFITSKAIYLQLKQDVLKIIMNTMLIQIVTTIDIPIEALTWFVFTAPPPLPILHSLQMLLVL